jgi:predicted transcriptional regulator
MSQPAPRHFPDPAVETPSEREVRLAWERARLAEADADFAAGRYISGEEADAWLAQEMAEAQAAFEREGD